MKTNSTLGRLVSSPKTWLAVFFIAVTQLSNAQVVRWARGSRQSVKIRSVATDNAGNNFIVGSFDGTVDFDFTTAIFELSAPETGLATFIAKYDRAGAFLWAKRFTSIFPSGNVEPVDATVDAQGNIYITGAIDRPADFNASDAPADTAIIRPLFDVSENFYSTSIYIAKYDASGNFMYVKNLEGGTPSVRSITSKGNRVYLTGSIVTFAAVDNITPVDTDLDPSSATLYLTGPTRNNPFFAVYDLAGNLVLAKRLNSTNENVGLSIDGDADNNIFISGQLNGTLNLVPSVSLTGTTSRFVAKYDPSGALIWGKPVLTTEGNITDNIGFLEVTKSGEVYVSGPFLGTTDFDPSASELNLVSGATGTGISSYLSHFKNNGDFVSAYSLNSTISDLIGGIDSDDSSNVYIAGEMSGTADFNFGAGTTSLVSVGTIGLADVFFAKYNTNDQLVWARKIGNNLNQLLTGGLSVNAGTLNIAGNFDATANLNFNPVTGTGQTAVNLPGPGEFLASYFTSTASADKNFLTFGFNSPLAEGTITGTNIAVRVPSTANLSALAAVFTVSPNATVSIAGVPQFSGFTLNNFNSAVTYTVTAQNGTTQTYTVTIDIITDYNDNTIASELSVYPNPVSDVLHLTQASDVEIHTVTGNLVKKATNVTSISVNDLAPGVYMVTDGNSKVTKITIY